MDFIKVHSIEPDGTVNSSEWPADKLPRDKMRAIVGGEIEYAAVLFNDRPATMVVNEIGASFDKRINPKGPLQPNARATAIYWNATIRGRTGVTFEPLMMPMIHGTVLLLERDKRKL